MPRQFNDNPFADHLEVVAAISGRCIEQAISELRHQDELTKALRTLLKQGVDINDLSEATGLSPATIRTRVQGELALGEDLDELVGLR